MMLLILSLSSTAFFFFRQSVPSEVRGKFSQLGEVEFSYNKYQVEAISPLCGCYREFPPDKWRGITFAARYLSVARKGDLPLTQYIISAPEPTNTFWNASEFKIGLTVYGIKLPEGVQFDPRALVSGAIPETYSLTVKQELTPEKLYLVFSENEMNVAMLGDKPLGAWVPSEASQVALKYEKKMSLASPVEATIEENYVAHTMSQEVEELQGIEMGLPLGDFLGPNVVLWWNSSSSSIVSTKEMIPLSIPQEKGQKTVIAVVINPPFSVRVALNAASPDQIQELYNYNKKYSDEYHVNYPRRAGSVVLTIKNPQDQVADFNEIYNRLKQNELTVAHNIPIESERYRSNRIDMAFRYPPIPPNNGFNVFGPIRHLTLSSAVGAVLIGTRQYDITAPSVLELKNVQSLEVQGGIISVPLQLTPGPTSQPELELQAKSEIYINKESRNQRSDSYRFGEYFGVLSIFVSFASAVVSLWAFARGYKQRL